jgi:hypothetical protein
MGKNLIYKHEGKIDKENTIWRMIRTKTEWEIHVRIWDEDVPGIWNTNWITDGVVMQRVFATELNFWCDKIKKLWRIKGTVNNFTIVKRVGRVSLLIRYI